MSEKGRRQRHEDVKSKPRTSRDDPSQNMVDVEHLLHHWVILRRDHLWVPRSWRLTPPRPRRTSLLDTYKSTPGQSSGAKLRALASSATPDSWRHEGP